MCCGTRRTSIGTRATSPSWAGQPERSIRYGRELVVDTARHIGKSATDPAKRFAGNNLACVNCHLNAGLQPFAAPFVSTFATFPMLVDDQVLTLTGPLNGCMRRSMNGKDLPGDGREMEALSPISNSWAGHAGRRARRGHGTAAAAIRRLAARCARGGGLCQALRQLS